MPSTSVSDAPIRVVHVDDDPEVGSLVAAALQQSTHGFDVVTHTDAETALDHVAREDVDCVVSDYDMPDVDGLAFLRALRASHPRLPFIFFTGHGSEDVAVAAITAGVTDYLRKRSGFDQYAALADRIREAVAVRRDERSLEESRSFGARVLSLSPTAIVVVDTDGRVTRRPEPRA